MYKVYIQYKTIKNERENSNVRLYKSVSLSAVRLFSRKAFFSRRLLTVRKIKKTLLFSVIVIMYKPKGKRRVM